MFCRVQTKGGVFTHSFICSKKLKINCNVPVVVDDKQSAAGVSSDVSKQEIEQDRVFKLRVCSVGLAIYRPPAPFCFVCLCTPQALSASAYFCT